MKLRVFNLQTAILMSLFTDRRVNQNELPPGEVNRRGWWGDCLNKGVLGSKLWLLKRRKLDTDTLEDAKRYATHALEWLVSSGRAQSLDVSVELIRRGQIQIQVAIQLLGENEPEIFHLTWPTGELYAV